MKLYYYGYYRFEVMMAIFWWCGIALFKPFIVNIIPFLNIPLRVLNYVIPAYYLAYPLIIHFKRKRQMNRGVEEIVRKNVERMAKTPLNNEQELSQEFQPQSLLTSAQIKRLNEFRNKVSIENIKTFPMLRVSGRNMTDLIPGAGLFTARINRYGEFQNVVLMLSTMNAVSEFEKLCFAYGALPKDYWAEGYLLPSRTGICYSVLFVTSFRFCGRQLTF